MSYDLPTLCQDIQRQARKLGYDIQGAFEYQDLKNSGFVFNTNFRAILSDLQIWISDESYREIAKQFTEGNKIDYNKFMATYHKYIGKEASEKDFQLLYKFAREVDINGVNVAQACQRYDRYMSGEISVQAFQNIFSNSRLTPQIIEQYANKRTGMIDYRVLTEDLNEAKALKPDLTVASTINLSKARDVSDLLFEFAKAIQSYHVDINQIFTRLDHYRRGFVDPHAFMRESANFGINLPADQIALVADAYTNPRGNFEYTPFLEDLKKCQAELPLKSTGFRPVSTAPQTARRVYEAPRVTAADVVARLKSEVADRHSLINERLEFYDRDNTGKLSQSMFLGTLEQEGFALTREEGQVLSREYMDQDRMIDIARFSKDVMPPQRLNMAAFDETVEFVRTYLLRNRIFLLPRLQAIDRGNTGFVSFEDFVQQMTSTRLALDIRQRNFLRRLFADRNNRVAYRDACAQLDPPADAFPPLPPPVSNDERPKPAPFVEKPKPEPSEDVKEALGRLAATEDKFQTSLFSEFASIAKNTRCMVRPSQFNAVLLKLRVPEADAALLTQRYSDGQFCCYSDLERDIETYGRRAVEQNPGLTQTVKPDYPEVSQAAQTAVKKIRQVLGPYNTDIGELFVAYDRSGLGFVPANRLVGILTTARVFLPPADIDALLAAFCDVRVPERFNYRRMCSVKADVSPDELKTFRVQPEVAIDNPTNSVITALREKIYARRRRPADVFVGADPEGITQTEFRRRIEGFGVLLRGDEVSCLVRHYKLNMRGDIDWQRFVSDVEKK